MVPGLTDQQINLNLVRLRRGRWRTLRQKLALALFDDAARTGEVLARINRSDRGWADAVRWANSGAHGAADAAANLPPMVGATERLASWLSKRSQSP